MKLLRTWRLINGGIFADLFGGLMTRLGILSPLVTVVYSVSMVIDASLGNDFVFTITDAVAFALAAPTNPPPTGFSQVIRVTARNTSGGAHGAGTFNAAFKVAAAGFPAIATATSRTFEFRWDGTNWVENFRSAADIAN